jgi:hypothetical protein
MSTAGDLLRPETLPSSAGKPAPMEEIDSMIVNERENKRTIDTETGVYLRQMGTDSREMVWKFSVFDGDTVIAFEASRSGKRLVPGAKIFSVHYLLDLNILFRGRS